MRLSRIGKIILIVTAITITTPFYNCSTFSHLTECERRKNLVSIVFDYIDNRKIYDSYLSDIARYCDELPEIHNRIPFVIQAKKKSRKLPGLKKQLSIKKSKLAKKENELENLSEISEPKIAKLENKINNLKKRAANLEVDTYTIFGDRTEQKANTMLIYGMAVSASAGLPMQGFIMLKNADKKELLFGNTINVYGAYFIKEITSPRIVYIFDKKPPKNLQKKTRKRESILKKIEPLNYKLAELKRLIQNSKWEIEAIEPDVSKLEEQIKSIKDDIRVIDEIISQFNHK